jgi:hypothetical protein
MDWEQDLREQGLGHPAKGNFKAARGAWPAQLFDLRASDQGVRPTPNHPLSEDSPSRPQKRQPEPDYQGL